MYTCAYQARANDKYTDKQAPHLFSHFKLRATSVRTHTHATTIECLIDHTVPNQPRTDHFNRFYPGAPPFWGEKNGTLHWQGAWGLKIYA